MSDEPIHQPYEWADQMFSGKYDVAPKYRDMLAMLAATLMGNPGAAQHFYNRAIVDGASDEELHRAVEIVKSTNIQVGDLVANVENAAEEIRAGQEQADDTTNEAGPPSPN